MIEDKIKAKNIQLNVQFNGFDKLAMYINAQFSFTIIGQTLPTYKEGGFLSYLDNPIGGTGFLTGSQAR